ncbi:EpsG family protein [Lelliottia amnigena]|uniref:EpsG family protein n=1 Tax=Lelliottia amnigena TaxID=61646 RepID=A0ABU7UC87_LELAM
MNKLKFSTLLILIGGIVLILLAGFKPIGLDRDSQNYVNMIQASFNIDDLYLREPSFNLLQLLNEIIFSGSTTSFFLIFAVLGVALKIYAIQKGSDYPLLSFVLYVFFYYILHDLTQIRVGVASALFLLAINDKINNHKRKAIIKIIIAVSFHYSAIIGLLLFILNGKRFNKLLYFILPTIGILLSILLTTNTFSIATAYMPSVFAQKINTYIILQDRGSFNKINLFNFYYSGLLLIYYSLIFIIKENDFKNILYLKFLGFGLFFFYALSFLPVLAFRISEFYCIVIIILFANVSKYFKQLYLFQALIFTFGLGYFVTQGLMNNINL